MAEEKYKEESAPHHNSEMPKSAKGGNFSNMKTLETTNPKMKKQAGGSEKSKDHAQPFDTDNPKGAGRAKRHGDGLGKNPAHGY